MGFRPVSFNANTDALMFQGTEASAGRDEFGRKPHDPKKARRNATIRRVYEYVPGLFCLLQEGNHDVAFTDIRSDTDPSGHLGLLQHNQLLMFIQPAEDL